MPDRDGTAESADSVGWIESQLVAAGSPEPDKARRAREELVALAANRVRSLAHRMLAGSGRVRRWEETDDIVQNALLRLHRALAAVIPNDGQHFLRLTALQVRRELVDLARRHGRDESTAANHETNSISDTEATQRVDVVADGSHDAVERMERWSRFHEVASSLPADQREIFDMVWYLGMTQEQIAAALDSSPRTIRRRWDETKKRFTTLFTDEPPD